MNTRSEHLQFAKDRAMEYIKDNKIDEAWLSFVSDLRAHNELKDHSAISLGMQLYLADAFTTINELEKFINKFN